MLDHQHRRRDISADIDRLGRTVPASVDGSTRDRLGSLAARLSADPRQFRLAATAVRLNAAPRLPTSRHPIGSSSSIVQRVISPGTDQMVRSAATGEMVKAQWNEKYQRFDIMGPHGYIEQVDPDTRDYGESEDVEETASTGSDQYSSDASDVEPIMLDPEKRYTFHFTMLPGVVEAVNKRRQDITGDDEPDFTTLPGHLPFLRDTYQKAEAVRGGDTYPVGKGKGKISQHLHLGTNIAVRLDKIGNGKGSVNARVSQAGGEDKKTEDLGHLVDNPAVTDPASFLAGVRGEHHGDGVPSISYRSGVEARMVALTSDVADHPGNSALAERFLANVHTADDYRRLFIGSGDERSYGALPSQNQANEIEDERERKGPYKFIGDLLRTGEAKASAATSAIPKLRKMRSMLLADPDFVSIKVAKKKNQRTPIDAETFSNYVAARAMMERHAVAETAAKKRLLIESDAEDNTDDERERVSVLSDAQKQKKIARLLKLQERLDRKKRALGADDDGVT